MFYFIYPNWVKVRATKNRTKNQAICKRYTGITKYVRNALIITQRAAAWMRDVFLCRS